MVVTTVSISSLVSICTGSNSRRPSRVRLRIADDQAVHLGDRRLDEPERFGEVFRKLLVGPFEHGLGGVGRVFRGLGSGRLRPGKRCDPPEDVAAQFLQFAGEAHDVHQRRAQVVADDIGEALDLVIGFAQVGGAFVDRGLEIEIVVAQLRFGVVAGARRSAAPGRWRCRQARSRGRSRRSSRRRRAPGVRSAVRGPHGEQPAFLGAHGRGWFRRWFARRRSTVPSRKRGDARWRRRCS